MLTPIILTILITENIFLIFLLIIWLNRNCQKCQQVKCLEQVFNKLCQPCQKNLTKANQVEI